MTRHSRVTSEQVDVVPIHSHDQVPERPFIRYAGDSDFLPFNILSVVMGREVQMVPASILCFNNRLEATMKIKTFKSSLCRALP